MSSLAPVLLSLFILGPSRGAPGPEAVAAVTWTHEATFTSPEGWNLSFAGPIALGTATIAVGLSIEEAATVFVYNLTDGGWSEPEQLTFPGSWNPDVIGFSGDDMLTVLTDAGLYTSVRVGSDWGEPVEVLPAAGPTWAFLSRVSIADDAMVVDVGALPASCAVVQHRTLVFRRDDRSWVDDGVISSAGCSAEETEVRDLALGSGRFVEVVAAVPSAPVGEGRVYRRTGDASWELETSMPGSGNFGYDTAAISGATIALGAPGADQNGRVDIFVNRGAGWDLEQSFYGKAGEFSPDFGRALAIHGNLMAIGAPMEDFIGEFTAGTVYLYGFSGEWVEEGSVAIRETNNNFGTDLALRGSRLVVGTRWFEEPDPHNVHVFTREGEAPAGMCLDDSQCIGGPCIDGTCASAPGGDDDADGGEKGCGCHADTGQAPLAALTALLGLGLRRRRDRAHRAKP